MLVGLDTTMLTTPQTDANSSAPVWQIIEAGMEIPTTIPFLEPPPDDTRQISSSPSILLENFVETLKAPSLNLHLTMLDTFLLLPLSKSSSNHSLNFPERVLAQVRR